MQKMTTEQVLAKAQELGEMLAASEVYDALNRAEADLELDGAAQDAIAKAEIIRAELREQLEGGTPPEQLQEGLAQLRAANAAIGQTSSYAAADAARKEFADLMNRINTLLKFHTGQEEEGGCGGDCSSCSSCG